jgi:hypothetical protein
MIKTPIILVFVLIVIKNSIAFPGIMVCIKEKVVNKRGIYNNVQSVFFSCYNLLFEVLFKLLFA